MEYVAMVGLGLLTAATVFGIPFLVILGGLICLLAVA